MRYYFLTLALFSLTLGLAQTETVNTIPPQSTASSFYAGFNASGLVIGGVLPLAQGHAGMDFYLSPEHSLGFRGEVGILYFPALLFAFHLGGDILYRYHFEDTSQLYGGVSVDYDHLTTLGLAKALGDALDSANNSQPTDNPSFVSTGILLGYESVQPKLGSKGMDVPIFVELGLSVTSIRETLWFMPNVKVGLNYRW